MWSLWRKCKIHPAAISRVWLWEVYSVSTDSSNNTFYLFCFPLKNVIGWVGCLNCYCICFGLFAIWFLSRLTKKYDIWNMLQSPLKLKLLQSDSRISSREYHDGLLMGKHMYWSMSDQLTTLRLFLFPSPWTSHSRVWRQDCPKFLQHWRKKKSEREVRVPNYM